MQWIPKATDELAVERLAADLGADSTNKGIRDHIDP